MILFCALSSISMKGCWGKREKGERRREKRRKGMRYEVWGMRYGV